MKVLIACEESQAVCIAFREQGHEAYSCDILDCSGGHSEWHIKGDAIKEAYSGKYDMMIAHPPCTYLANSGVQYLSKDPCRWFKMDEARAFFMRILNADIPKKCIENPIPHFYCSLPKYSQIIHPWQHGHETMKKTCLWIAGLPELKPSKVVSTGKKYDHPGRNRTSGSDWYNTGNFKERCRMRKLTFQGIADAMASQWG